MKHSNLFSGGVMFNYKRYIIAALFLLALPIKGFADDTEIYGAKTVTIPPNVMIIMDNSGSMQTVDVPGDPYDPLVDYSSTVKSGYTVRTKDMVYYKSSGKWYAFMDVNATAMSGCPSAQSELKTKGYVYGVLITTWGTKKCGEGSKRDLVLGNYLNYENSTLSADKARYVVAKDAIASLLNSAAAADKKFGMAHFYRNGNDPYTGLPIPTEEGGYIQYKCGEKTNSELATYVAGRTSGFFNTNTPLAETLAETGRYFAGLQSWFTAGVTHTTPIEYRCQNNYIILVTDGEPTQDKNVNLYKTTYIGGKIIGDAYIGPNGEDKDFDAAGKLVSSLLNDVAYFLYNNDILPDTAGIDVSYGKQSIVTYTIGFTTNDTANALLALTAKNGGGEFYPASTSSSLTAALEAINQKINVTNAVFLAPAVPVNRTTRTSQSDWLYLAFFKPQNTGEWLGNIKKFALGKNGEIYGKNPETGEIDTSESVVNELGIIKNNSCSFWSTNCPDGNDVEMGGLGDLMNDMGDRTIYTYTGTKLDLKDATNIFSLANLALPVSAEVVADTLFFKKDWKLGAVIHSEPTIVHYSPTQSIIYVGANDGMLHCFDDKTGAELWAFVPPGQFDNLAKINDAEHDYFVDGSISIVYGDLMEDTQLFQPLYMIFGERRGGYNYYVLDITDYNNPKWKYQIPSNIWASENLGQSWSKPKVCTLSTDTETVNGKVVPKATALQNVFMLAGGYDDNQDLPTPQVNDTKGRAILSLNIGDKSLGKFKVGKTTMPSMNNCIVDVNVVSTYRMTDGTEIATRIYAGDFGGKVFTFADDRYVETNAATGEKTVKSRVPNGDFPIKNFLFNAEGKEIYYAPVSSKIKNSYDEWVVFGTGDREDPLNTTEVNYIYAIKNTWMKSGLTKDNLKDISSLMYNKEAALDLGDKDGWCVSFIDPGEKMISPAIITNDTIYFTTYVPESGVAAAADPCDNVGAAGSSYLWAIDLVTGAPVTDYNNDGVKTPDERRMTAIATMAQPKLIGDMITTPRTIRIPTKINFDYFFWRQR